MTRRTQLGRTALGARMRCGPSQALYCASAATSPTVCTVLPSPISSANTPADQDRNVQLHVDTF